MSRLSLTRKPRSRKVLITLLIGGAAILGLLAALASCGGATGRGGPWATRPDGGKLPPPLAGDDSGDSLLARTGSGASSPWQMFGKNSLRTGRSDKRGPATEQLLWRYSTPTATSEPAIAADGTIYVATLANTTKGKGSLYAVRPNGTRRWAYSYDGHGTSPVVGEDGTVYFSTHRTSSGVGSDRLFALTSGGRLKWSYLLNGGSTGYMSDIALGNDGTILVSSYAGYLHAINPNGTQRWVYGPTGKAFYQPAAVGTDGTIYAGCKDDQLYAFNPDGSLKWTYLAVGPPLGPSIGADGTIYVGTSPWLEGVGTPGVLHAINPNGTNKWTYNIPGSTWFNPAIAGDGTVIVTCFKRVETDELQGAVIAVDANGNQKWIYNQSSDWYLQPNTGAVVDADGTVFVGYRGGTGSSHAFVAIDANGSQKWIASLTGRPWEAAAIGADGTVYIGGRADLNLDGVGALSAFGPGTP